MIIETTLAQNIDSAEKNAAYDASCKRLLANKLILAWIMKICIAEYAKLSIQEIAETCIEGIPEVAKTAVHPDQSVGEQIRGMSTEDSSMNEGTVTYDIRFRAIVPATERQIDLIINIEAQNDFYPGYPLIKRAIYYCSRMISAQYGTEFTGSHYEKMKKVYSIWICMNPPKYRKNSINRYIMREERLYGEITEEIANYDLLTTVILCLGNADEPANEILKLLEVLLSSERESEEKKQILQSEFSIQMTKELESEVSTMCNLSKGVEEKGIQKGIQKGRLETLISLVKEHLLSLGDAAKTAGMTDEEFKKLL